jgi:hypothetical protein
LAVRDVVIATQREVATLNATYAATPPLAGVLTAKAIAQGAVRVATIVAQTVPQLAQGGVVLKGPSHAQGGVLLGNVRSGRVFAEAEGGEVVLTRGVSQNPALLRMASQLNQLAGGVRLEGFAAREAQLAEGGVLPRGAQVGTEAAVVQALANLAEQLARRPVVVSVQEINAVQERVRVLEQAAQY